MNNRSVIESILYVCGSDGVQASDIKKVLDIPSEEIHEILKEIKNDYDHNENSGLTIKSYDGYYHLLTKAENQPIIAKLIDIKAKNPLTTSLLETLAIIAYNSPCTANKIQQIRNIDPSANLQKLQALNLIKLIGRADTPGRPYLYEVTEKFYNLFGIKNKNDLPKLEDMLQNLSEIDETEDFFNSNRYDDEEE